MKVLVVDDEGKSRETISVLLNKYCDEAEVCGAAGNITDAIDLIHKHKPDLLLLDITMPGGSGFDLLNNVPVVDFEVIFITAHNTYGIQAIKSGASDYLLKPVSILELQNAIEQVARKIEEKNSRSDTDTTNSRNERPEYFHQKIAVPSHDGFHIIEMNEIISLSSDGSYTYLMLVNGKKILSSKHLKEYHKILPESLFVRVHHGHIINLKHVKYYQRGEGGTITMSDNSHVLVSKRKKKDFLDKFNF